MSTYTRYAYYKRTQSTSGILSWPKPLEEL